MSPTVAATEVCSMQVHHLCAAFYRTKLGKHSCAVSMGPALRTCIDCSTLAAPSAIDALAAEALATSKPHGGKKAGPSLT